jgi:ADP-ribosylglycohydrolase
MSDRDDRIKGVLVGQAAGDALGVGYETGKRSRWRAKMIGGRSGFGPGEWTDDTQQAIIVARARSEPVAVARGLLDWYAEGPKNVEMSTAAVLSRAGGEPARVAGVARECATVSAARPVPEGWDPGMTNGSLARTGPVCLPFLGDREKIVQAARDICDLTHAEPYAGDACVLWSLAIERAVLDGDGYDEGGRGDDGMGLGGFDLRAEFERDCELWLPVERRGFWSQTIAVACTPKGATARNLTAVGAFKAALSAIEGSAIWPTASSPPSQSAATPARWQPSPGPCRARCTAPRRSPWPGGGTCCTAGRAWTPTAWSSWPCRRPTGQGPTNR